MYASHHGLATVISLTHCVICRHSILSSLPQRSVVGTTPLSTNENGTYRIVSAFTLL